MLRRPGFARSVARTAGFNIVATGASGLAMIIVARAVGPAVRGEFAAVTSWFAVIWAVGGMGQPAALCYYVAKDPPRAHEYVATSRAMMLATSMVALVAGLLLAPVLAQGIPSVATAYRIAFGSSIVAFVGASFTWSLQGRDLRRWNVAWVTQPVSLLVAVVILWRLRWLTLDVAVTVIGAASLVQLIWSYQSCRRVGLVPGRVRTALIRPLAAYGIAQIAALAPATLNADLDQIVLSQTVPAADLGRYAIAVSLSVLPMPLVAAIGNVAFPRLAAQREVTGATQKLQRFSVLTSVVLAVTILIPIAVTSYWLVPLVFGAAYRGAVPLLWILTPGSIFLISGQVTGDLLRGRHQPSAVAWAQGIALVVTVVLLLALLPFIGVYGAAIASTVSYGLAFVMMSRRLSRLPRHAGGMRHRRSRAVARPETRVPQLNLGQGTRFGQNPSSGRHRLVEASGSPDPKIGR